MPRAHAWFGSIQSICGLMGKYYWQDRFRRLAHSMKFNARHAGRKLFVRPNRSSSRYCWSRSLSIAAKRPLAFFFITLSTTFQRSKGQLGVANATLSRRFRILSGTMPDIAKRKADFVTPSSLTKQGSGSDKQNSTILGVRNGTRLSTELAIECRSPVRKRRGRLVLEKDSSNKSCIDLL